MNITGIHHISIISGHGQETIDFVTSVLGLRFVKRTLNFDDPSMYHLYFGNNTGDSGILLTYFPQVIKEKIERNDNNNSTTIFRIPRGSIEFWVNRLNRFGVSYIKRERFNDIYLAFSDMHNVKYELVESDDLLLNYNPLSSVDPKFAISGFYGVIVSSRNVIKTSTFLQEELELKLQEENHQYIRFIIKGSFNSYLDLYNEDIVTSRDNLGNIHHVAFTSEASLLEWKNKLNKNKFYSSEIMDRTYFKSLYFHEPGGNLFELATNGPGLLIDQNLEDLGNELIIPEKYQNQVSVITEKLMPLFNQEVEALSSYSYLDKQSYDIHIAHKVLLARINELAAKNKTKAGLSVAEVEERAILRKKYVRNILKGTTDVLDNVRVVDDEGNESKLMRKEVIKWTQTYLNIYQK